MDGMKEGSIRRVGVVLKTSSAEAVGLGHRLIAELKRLGLEPVVDCESAAAVGLSGGPERVGLAAAVDLVVVLGGDGTLLSVTHGELGGTPILGINMGSLGFLTEHPSESLLPILNDALQGRATAERRERLEVSVIPPSGVAETRFILNDAVINKSALARMIVLSVHVDNHFVSRFRADGLIVATPTGSTAYNLSAGGPILFPTLNVLLVTPICPHTLTNRPIGLPLSSVVEIRLESTAEEVFLTLDGQHGQPLTAHDLIRISLCAEPVALLVEPNRSFFRILNRKLKWGEHG